MSSPPYYHDNLVGTLKARELHAALAARSAELAPAKLLAVADWVNRIQFPEKVYNGTVGGLSIACVCNELINKRTAPTEMSPCNDAAARGPGFELVDGKVVGTQGVIPVEGATVEEEAGCIVAEVKRLMVAARPWPSCTSRARFTELAARGTGRQDSQYKGSGPPTH
jgi:hypothetical protein